MTLIDKAEALAPCPFCGGGVSVTTTERVGGIVCDAPSECIGSGLLIVFDLEDMETAIAAWNRRAVLPARGVGVKPLKFGQTYFVAHASGAFTFFTYEEEARAYAYELDRFHHAYNDDAVSKFGQQLRQEHDDWLQELQVQHRSYVLSALDPDALAPDAREAALMEAHKAILAMDTKKDEDMDYNLAILRVAERVRRLIGEDRT